MGCASAVVVCACSSSDRHSSGVSVVSELSQRAGALKLDGGEDRV